MTDQLSGRAGPEALLPDPEFTPADFPACCALLGWSLPPPLPDGVIALAVQELVDVARRVFVSPHVRHPVAVELGDQSNPSAEPEAGVIRLRQESVDEDRRLQLLYNAAHEAQHYACFTGVGSWVDEMLAEIFAVAVMHTLNPEYGLPLVQTHEIDSDRLSYHDMAATPYPWGFGAAAELYGRAFVRVRSCKP